MQQGLIGQQNQNINESTSNRGGLTSFHQCLRYSEGSGKYQKKLFLIIAAHWIFASFFIALPYFLFKRPTYCQISTKQYTQNCCIQGDYIRANQICIKYQNQIIKHVKQDQSLTFLFQLFCNKQWIRVLLQIFPQILPFIGFLLYGAVSDIKGRKVALTITWRMYTVGIIMFSIAQAQFLKIAGYVIASIHCLPTLLIQFVLIFQHNSKKQKNSYILIIVACLTVGPLILSVTSGIFQQINNWIVLVSLCAVPAFILCLFYSQIYESAICMYPSNKALAFGILNSIAKQNKKQPILIDLSLSSWYNFSYSRSSLINLLKTRTVNIKMIFGFLFFFTVYFTIKISQIALDSYIQTQQRSRIVNIPSFVADLTLCLFLLRFKGRTCRHINIVKVVVIISLLALHWVSFEKDTMSIITIIHVVILRYCSQLCLGILLIWSIQTFPTICRNYCVGFIFCGSCLGVLVAYLLREHIQDAFILSLVCTTMAIVFEGYLQINKYGIMKDTLDDKYYDEFDSFYKA